LVFIVFFAVAIGEYVLLIEKRPAQCGTGEFYASQAQQPNYRAAPLARTTQERNNY
jgi:hypothetical protein